MTNTQLYLAIGVPFFTLLVVLLTNNHSMKLLGDRIGDLGSRIDGLGKELGSRIDGLDSRLGRLETKVDAISTDLREFYATQRQHETRLDSLERKQAS